MTALTALLERNRAYATTREYEGLAPLPRRRLLVVTCIDSRVDPARFLGLDLGDALILRNSGGRVTREVVEEIVLVTHMSQAMLGDDAPPFEVAIVHHTRCGTAALADEDFRRTFAARVGGDVDELAGRAVTDPVVSVQNDVSRLLLSAELSPRVSVSGHVYDVETGLVHTHVAVQQVAA